jgi:hypothetical protein
MRDEFALGAMSCQNLAREVFDLFDGHLMKVTILRTLEQRSVIRSLLKDGLAAKEIPARLSQVSGADVTNTMHAFYSVREIPADREDVSDGARHGRPCQINLGAVLVPKLELDSDTMARKPAFSRDVSVQTVTNHLHHKVGMKCSHLRWTPHALDSSHRAERVCSAPIMLEARTNYQYLRTGDESWMIDDQLPSEMWTLDRNHFAPRDRPSTEPEDDGHGLFRS